MPHAYVSHYQSRRKLIIFALILCEPLLLFAAAVSALALAGYLFGTDYLYRPLKDGMATNPVTAMCAICIALAFLSLLRRRRMLALTLATVAQLIITVVVVDKLTDSHLSSFFTRFNSLITRSVDSGLANAMGINTAWMLFLLALSLQARIGKNTNLSQLFASVALIFPLPGTHRLCV